MIKEIDVNSNVGDIVTSIPPASEVFKEYKIDFCCGGNRPLAQVIEEQNLAENEILTRLNELIVNMEKQKEQPVNWEDKSLSEIIDYIVNTHHTYLNKQLPRTSELTLKILRAHGLNHKELSEVHKLFHDLKSELEQHLIKEEEVLFPIIKDYEKKPSHSNLEKTIEVVNELENEHDIAGDVLKKLRQITKDYRVPDDGCPTYSLAYQTIEKLESDIFQHVHLENNILFPKLTKEIKLNNLSFS